MHPYRAVLASLGPLQRNAKIATSAAVINPVGCAPKCPSKHLSINRIYAMLLTSEFLRALFLFGFTNADTTGVLRKNVSKTYTFGMRRLDLIRLEPFRSRKFCHLHALASNGSVAE
jgi:hypothetical protein